MRGARLLHLGVGDIVLRAPNHLRPRGRQMLWLALLNPRLRLPLHPSPKKPIVACPQALPLHPAPPQDVVVDYSAKVPESPNGTLRGEEERMSNLGCWGPWRKAGGARQVRDGPSILVPQKLPHEQ